MSNQLASSLEKVLRVYEPCFQPASLEDLFEYAPDGDFTWNFEQAGDWDAEWYDDFDRVCRDRNGNKVLTVTIGGEA